MYSKIKEGQVGRTKHTERMKDTGLTRWRPKGEQDVGRPRKR